MGNQFANHAPMSPRGSYDRKRGALKVIFLGAGEGGKATMYKQLVHMYGNKKCKRVDNAQTTNDPKDMEDDSVNSFMNDESRKSFIPIIHRNTLLAMFNLIQGAVNTFNCKKTRTTNKKDDLELDTHPLIKEAIDSIFEERDHAISFEDWSLKSKVARHVSYLWNMVPQIQQTFQRRNELELEYMESAKYWFGEINRVIQPNYVPTMRDIFRVRVKTTGIVESDIHIPIKIVKKSRTPSRDLSDAVFEKQEDLGQLKYKRVKLVLMGSQRNERKKWIHAFHDVNAVIFVVALSEYNQVLYEDGRTNRLRESLLLFEEIANSQYFANVPIYLFLNKRDVFLEKISIWDLSGVFPELPNDLRLKSEENLQAKFLPLLIAERVANQNEEMSLQTPKGKHDANLQVATVSEEEDDDTLPVKKEGRVKRFLKKKIGKKEKKKEYNMLTLSTMMIDNTELAKRRSSVFTHLIEVESNARNSTLKSISNFSATGKFTNSEDIEAESPLSACDTLSEYEFEIKDNTLMSLPTDALLYVCLFMEASDLCQLNLVSHEWYNISNSEIVWRALCLRYGDVDEQNVIKFYDEWLEKRKQKHDILKKYVSFRNISPINKASSLTPRTPVEYTAIRKGRYKHYFEMGCLYATRNIDYIYKAFMERTTRTDVVTFVTCAVDSASFKPLLEQTMLRIIRGPTRDEDE